MKIKLFITVSFFIGASCAFAANMDALIKRNQKNALPKFPVADAKAFAALQEAAQAGDSAAQKKLPAMLGAYMKDVYLPLSKGGGVLFSVRRPVKGYDDAANNYAVNLESFFEETTGRVKVEKRNFSVAATDGTVFQVRYPEYKPADASIEVTKDGQTKSIALAELNAADKQFVGNVFADEIFESSGEFDISSEDSRSGDVSRSEKDRVSSVSSSTGEKVVGAFVSTAAKGISRRIILENKGAFPLENLVVEYQSFAEQTVMGLPKDFPSDYRCVGFFEVASIGPGEKKELALDLPETVDAKQATIETGGYEYYRLIPADLNQHSEGRMNGIWVKVHRLTPYGERLTREYKSSGVPDVEWSYVAPVGADVR